MVVTVRSRLIYKGPNNNIRPTIIIHGSVPGSAHDNWVTL